MKYIHFYLTFLLAAPYSLLAQNITLKNQTHANVVTYDTISNGIGKMFYPNGEIIEGIFPNGDVQGISRIEYKGNTTSGFINIGDLSEAKVTMRNPTPEGVSEINYKGNVILHKANQSNEYDFLFGNHIVEKAGKGTLEILFESGDTLKYKGEFKDDIFHGIGSLKDTRNNFLYKGNFVDGKIEGEGKLYYENGSTYKGYLVDGEFKGNGRFKYSSSSKYAYYYGMWKNNKQHGKGMLKYKDGGMYYGEFYNGRPHGNGKRVFADGSSFEGTFKHGKPLKAFNTSLASK